MDVTRKAFRLRRMNQQWQERSGQRADCAHLILLLFASNLAWILYENSFEDETSQTAWQEADNGQNNFVGGDIVGETGS